MRKLFFLFLLFTILVGALGPSSTYAQGNPEQSSSLNPATYESGGKVISTNLTYVPLEPLVGVNQSGNARFGDLIAGFFRILINLGAFFAVVVFVAGGIAYMVSESTVTKLVGKERIKAALIGLGILGASWLILNTINPELIAFDRDVLSPAAPTFIREKTTQELINEWKSGYADKNILRGANGQEMITVVKNPNNKEDKARLEEGSRLCKKVNGKWKRAGNITGAGGATFVAYACYKQ